MVGLAAVTATAVAAQPQAAFTVPQDPDYLVLEYRQTHELLEADPIPLLRIYGDGRVLVHQPSYRVDAGDYELRLPRAELLSLVASLAARNVPSADVSALQRERRLAEEQRTAEEGTLFTIADATVSHLELRLESFTAAPGARAISSLHQSIVWPNLQSDAERFPSMPELAELAAAERQLQALAARPDLRRVN